MFQQQTEYDQMLVFQFDESDFDQIQTNTKSKFDVNSTHVNWHISNENDLLADDDFDRSRFCLQSGSILESNKELLAETELTLENLKNLFTSCYTCGVNWRDHHVSLDCLECGGYSMNRPCPVCDGACRREWCRDVSRSHDLNKAQWEGECGIYPSGLSDEEGLDKPMKDMMLSSS